MRMRWAYALTLCYTTCVSVLLYTHTHDRHTYKHMRYYIKCRRAPYFQLSVHISFVFIIGPCCTAGEHRIVCVGCGGGGGGGNMMPMPTVQHYNTNTPSFVQHTLTTRTVLPAARGAYPRKIRFILTETSVLRLNTQFGCVRN